MLGYLRTSFSRQVAGTTPDIQSGAAKWGEGMKRMFGSAAAVAMVLAAAVGLTGTVAARRNENASPVAKVSSEPAALSKPAPADLPDPSAKPALTIDVPVNGAIYPPDIIPPQFAWRDNNPAATVWRIQVVFGEHARAISAWSNGEKMQVGELDTSLSGYVPPELTPEHAASHTWRPDRQRLRESEGPPAALQFPGHRAHFKGPGQRAAVLSRCPPHPASP
jgi:hypothetical protein